MISKARTTAEKPGFINVEFRAGAINKFEYLHTIKKCRFESVEVQKESRITLPNEVLSVYLTDQEKKQYGTGETGIFSITVYAEKSVAKKEEPCCAPGCC